MDISNSYSGLAHSHIASVDALSASAERAEQRNYEKVAEDFESVFLSLVLKEMRNTLDESGGLFGSESSDTYGGMFDMMMGQSLAKGRHLGIADMIEQYLTQRNFSQPESTYMEQAPPIDLQT